ncbi:MAG: hypothetical protein UU22_C0008G0004 [Parcubacteria group bacterium GW2011_GWA2_40_8]|nr:MAG: hypothetical protein UU22_C0008G0004 [Parcubacteria group bacterium GW2011_GWA2_40_8]
MYWANFLHIYQPAEQTQDILNRVVNESYRPIIKRLKSSVRAKLTLNVNAILTELLVEHGYEDIIKDLRYLSEKGQLEFTESAKYHAFLPLIPKDEIKRQIELNHKINKSIFGEIYKPRGFFSPEMAFSREVADVVSDMGYEWMVLDEITESGKTGQLTYDSFFVADEFPKLKFFFRERKPSNIIMSGVARSTKSFIETLGEEYNDNRYLLTAMDGETFGHHRPGLEKLLFDIWDEASFKHILISEIPEYFKKSKKCIPQNSTWASTEKDLEEGTQFRSWKDPENALHTMQWHFLDFVHQRVIAYKGPEELQNKTRMKMDEAFASDQFWWASGKPWWSIEMIEKGAWKLLDTLKSIQEAGEDIEEGERFYNDIISTAFAWQRSGYIRQLAQEYKNVARIPFKERTIDENKPEVYDAFIEMMKDKMREASQNEDYEKAILWRDAIWKLETKNDIYDAIHATDLLRIEVPDWRLREIMDKYKEQYKKIRPGQPEHRDI